MYEADRELVSRMLAGEQRAFREFFDASAQRLTAFAGRRSGLDSASLEDVVQNALIKAVGNLAHYRGEAALFTWLSGICRHELADLRRKAARRPAHVSLFESGALQVAVTQLRAPEQEEPVVQLDDQQRSAAVMGILETLPEQYALVLEAKYGDGLAVADIARQLGVSMIAVQSLLARAREAFREQWRHNSSRAASGRSPQ